jgi:2-ketoarginine methyltransferase
MFHDQLVSSIAYTQKFVAAIAIWHFIDSGLYDRLAMKPSSAAMLAEDLSLESSRISALLAYLSTEGIVERTGDLYSLSESGVTLGPCRGWFRFFVAGYGGTYHCLRNWLAGSGAPPFRNFREVSVGSCEISRHGALPLTCRLIDSSGRQPNQILDIGCGNGMYLSDLCARWPALTAIGLECHEESYQAAIEEIRKRRLQERVCIVQAGAAAYLKSPDCASPDFIIAAFILHELLGELGRDQLVECLTSVHRRWPDSLLIAVETDFVIADERAMHSQLGRAYYNPYFLSQAMTGQVLQTRSEWHRLFKDAGLTVIDEGTIDPSVDPDGLEFGVLLGMT